MKPIAILLVLTAAASADEDVLTQLYDVSDLASAGVIIGWAIREEIAPGEWVLPHSIHCHEGRLVVRHRARVHARIQSYLDRLRGMSPSAKRTRVSVVLSSGLARTELVESTRASCKVDRSGGPGMRERSYRLGWTRFEAILDGGADRPLESPERLAGLIRRELAPDEWNAPAAIWAADGKIVVRNRSGVHHAIASALLARERWGSAPRPIRPADTIDGWSCVEESLLERVTRAVWWQPHAGGSYEFAGQPEPYEIDVWIGASGPIERIEVEPPVPFETSWESPTWVSIEAYPASGPFRVRYFSR